MKKTKMKKELYSEPIFDQKVSLIIKREKLAEEVKEEQDEFFDNLRKNQLYEWFWMGFLSGATVFGFIILIFLSISK